MAKAKRLNIYNKGRRTWPLVDGEKEVSLNPGKSVELDEVLVEKMIKNYPNDFVKGGKPEAEVTAEIKGYKKTITALETELEKLSALKEEIETLPALKEENAALKEEIETLKAAAEKVVDNEAK